jgi:hypothetical protein
MFGSCSHPQLKGYAIERHNAIVRLTAQAILEGAHGGDFMVMDACAKADLPGTVHDDTRPPAWLFDSAPPRDAHGNIAYRPDILLIRGLPLARTRARDFNPEDELRPAARGDFHIYIIEVGCASDWRHGQKTTEKTEQHRALYEHLLRDGWPHVHYSPATCLSFGFAGTMRKDYTLLLRTLGVDAKNANATARAAATTCHRYMQATVTARWQLAFEKRRPAAPS